uniref:Uncharacterized protein n=1 Tax=Panagrolaimus davidi TaxID=227884 RepID=A0A914QHL5_9BILA
MLQFLIDIGLIVGTFLDPSPTEPKPRYPREGWSEINRENNNAKELFGITIPEKPSEQLIKFVDFTNAAYLSYVFGVRVAFSTATKDDAEYYFGAVTDLSLNFLINDSATPSSCSMKYINSVLDLKVYGSRAIVKTFEYLHVKEDDLPQEVIDYGTHAIDFLRETFHQNCSEPGDESPQTSEGLKHVHQYNPSVRKDALKAFDKAHEENITANISVTNPRKTLLQLTWLLKYIF